MTYLKRNIEKLIKAEAKYFYALVLIGPRRVGKTTTVRKIAKSIHPQFRYVTLKDLEARKLALTSPDLFFKQNPPPVIVDEIQYAPELFWYVRSVIDRGAPPMSFWLIGSQSYGLRQRAKESLAGRALVITMMWLSTREILGMSESPPFPVSGTTLQKRVETSPPMEHDSLFEHIWKGSMPGFRNGKCADKELFYNNYLNSSIRFESKELARNIPTETFLRFLHVVAYTVGELLNVHKIAVQIGITDDTTRRMLSFLEQMGIIFILTPFTDDFLKRSISTPKVYFTDMGLLSYLTKHSTPQALQNSALSEAIVKNYVISEILKNCANSDKPYSVSFYRDKDGNEIDLILKMEDKLHPIQITLSDSKVPSKMKVFQKIDVCTIRRGEGIVICTANTLSQPDADTTILPIRAV